MKKAIKRFWGIGLIVIILSSFFVAGPVAPASGGVYTWSTDTTQPTVTNKLLAATANMSINDIAAASDGSAVYIVSNNLSGNYFYKSTNGGVAWTQPSGGTSTSTVTALPNTATDNWLFVACAPEDANFVVVASYNSGTTNTTMYLSTNGGTTFSSLSYPIAALTVTDLAVSAVSGPFRYIAVSGVAGTTGYLYSWNYGSAAPAWSSKATGFATAGTVAAVAFSPSFPSDNTVLFITDNNTTNNTVLHAYSYNTLAYDAAVDSSWPRVLETDALGLTINRACITLDPTFYMGDSASQIGFVGASILDNAGVEMGGVYRISTYTVASGTYTATQIMTATAIGNVAWDGTNLAAAPYNVSTASDAGITIYRSADALSSTLPTFTPSSTLKAPGTGYEAKLLWNGSNLLAVSRGLNSAVAKSADLGKSFNGIALVNSSWATITDFWVSTDNAVMYVVADDGTDSCVWRYKDAAWQRVMIKAADTGNTWMVRAAVSDSTAVFLAKKGATDMFASTNSGETSWTTRSCSAAVQDFAAETPSIVYAIGTTTNVVKSVNGAFTWGTGVNTQIGLYSGGNLYSLTLLSAGNLIVGGTTGGVSYSTNSGAAWTALPSNVGTGSAIVNAAGLGTGDTIYATDNITKTVKKWIIGTNTQVTGWTAGKVLATAGYGIVLNNGIVYALDATSNVTRILTPTIGISSVFADEFAAGVAFSNNAGGGKPINALKVSNTGTSTTLWAASATALYYWTEYLTVAANGPTTTFPLAGYMLPVNSISGATNNFVFQWSRPSNQGGAVSSAQTYAYTLNVYLDAAGFVLYATGAQAATSSASLSMSASTLATTLSPGSTYYWKVKTTSPVTSPYTPMLSFTVQSIAAPVPAIMSPANGSSITNQTPAFSWAPVTGTTQYEFQLSTTPTFGTTILTDTPNTAGALVPVTIPLTQGKQYFWRVRALQPVTGEWSAVANFFVAAPATTVPPVTITNIPAPTITIPAAQPAPVYTLAPQPVEEIAPSYIWAIIIIGGILVIAVIVLIVRTRRSV